eukprot:2284483-Rhodomonas_salina.2
MQLASLGDVHATPSSNTTSPTSPKNSTFQNVNPPASVPRTTRTKPCSSQRFSSAAITYWSTLTGIGAVTAPRPEESVKWLALPDVTLTCWISLTMLPVITTWCTSLTSRGAYTPTTYTCIPATASTALPSSPDPEINPSPTISNSTPPPNPISVGQTEEMLSWYSKSAESIPLPTTETTNLAVPTGPEPEVHRMCVALESITPQVFPPMVTRRPASEKPDPVITTTSPPPAEP